VPGGVPLKITLAMVVGKTTVATPLLGELDITKEFVKGGDEGASGLVCSSRYCHDDFLQAW